MTHAATMAYPLPILVVDDDPAIRELHAGHVGAHALRARSAAAVALPTGRGGEVTA